MSDDLRAAADRLRRYRSLTRLAPGEWIDEDGTAYDRDGRAELCEYVADDRLAEHPADSDTPVTADWLRAVGFGCDLGVFHVTRETDTDGAWHLHLSYSGWGAYLTRDGVTLQIPLPKTRGAVRRLAAALGIPLTESERG